MATLDDTEYSLLSNLLDALDRLYDQASGAIDTYALLHATACALPESNLHGDLTEAAAAVLAIVRSDASHREKNGAALAATYALRPEVAAAWGDGYQERNPSGGGNDQPVH